MLIANCSSDTTAIRAVEVVVDFEDKPDEILHVHVRGVDTGVRIRLDGTGDGVMLVVGDKTYRHPVGGSND